MNSNDKPSVLFICMGNICRSPTVEVIARTEFARAGIAAHFESAGTEDYHIGRGAEARSIAKAAAYGYDLTAHRARQTCSEDFAQFDHLLVMDRVNLQALERFRPRSGGVNPALFLGDDELPDPYYGTDADFERVIVLARAGVAALLARLRDPAANPR